VVESFESLSMNKYGSNTAEKYLELASRNDLMIIKEKLLEK
jgi:hypothetical protein